MSKQKLELTWIGKDERPKLEPRVLVDDPYKSYHAKHKVKDNDIFDNRLIFGDNLLALKALEQEFTGKIKCIYIDPPFNTGAAFEHYDDGLEHSKWLSLIRDRLDILYKLLREDGAFIVHIDDNEQAYLKVILDEKFGRGNFLNNIVIRDSHPSGLKLSSKDQTIVKTKSYMMVYRKSDALRLNPIYQSRNDWDMHFSIFIENEIKYSLRDKLLSLPL
jgi:adenine-specific DNA-methyltransferase